MSAGATNQSSTPATLLDLVGRAGLWDPRRVAALSVATARWGPTLAAPYAAAGLKANGPAVIDECGEVSFADLDRQSTALAKGLQALGIGRGNRVGIACRNHRDFVESTVAAAKTGLGAVYLNTSFAAPQMAEVLVRESVAAVFVDAELAHLVDLTAFDGPVVVTGIELGVAGEAADVLHADNVHSLEDVRRKGLLRPPLRASLPVAPILLTSGTTGTPKGAQRSNRVDPNAATGLLGLIPYRSDDVVAITSPLFHAWGLTQLLLASTLGATVALTTSFDAESTLAQIEREQVTVLAVVPAILQRLLASPALDTSDLSSLRVVASSGSALPVPVVEEWLERVGPNLYNLYGSTEVGQATLANPTDLLHAPATAGRPMPGSTVSILDDEGRELPTGEAGRIFVGNGSQFDGYTGGGAKQILDGLMSSGDVGYFDESGLLFVTGRADDMIVSGGENVFPQEIEDLLLGHPSISDVAAVGVDDDNLGQRLAVFIVKQPGAKLSATAVKRHVSSTLARHKTPRDVHFVKALPRTATGKIRRTELTA